MISIAAIYSAIRTNTRNNLRGKRFPSVLFYLTPFRAVILGLALTYTTPARAQIPKISDLNDFCLPARKRCDLAKSRNSLLSRKARLAETIASHNVECSRVELGTSLESSCKVAQHKLEELKNEYSSQVRRFNEDVSAASNSCSAIILPAKIPNSMTGPSFCTTVNERVYITTSSGKDAKGGSNAAGAGGL
jgi:hypothetical protein